MNDKHGPFDILFCTGNFFGRETPMETIDDLLENKLDCNLILGNENQSDANVGERRSFLLVTHHLSNLTFLVPMTTYFIGGDNGVPGIIERTALRKNGEICNNLFYLGKRSIITRHSPTRWSFWSTIIIFTALLS